MKYNSIWLAGIITAFAFGALGFSCDPDIDACDEGYFDCYGECIPEGEECIEPCPDHLPFRCDDGTCVADVSDCNGEADGCRPDNCDPNFYEDPDNLPEYDSSEYALRQLTNGAGNSGGDFRAIDGFAEDHAIHYWQMTEVYLHNNAPNDVRIANVFPEEVIVNRVFEFVTPNNQILYAQNPIIEITPDMPNYSPLVQVWYVNVPDNYIPNTIKSVAAIDDAAADIERTGIFVVPSSEVILLEVTDTSVGLQNLTSITNTDWRPGPLDVWMNSQLANALVDFRTSHDDHYSIWLMDQPNDDWTQMPEPWLATLWQPQGCGGQNVYEERNEIGNTLYSPVVVRTFFDPDEAACSSLPTNAAAILAGINDGTYRTSTQQEIIMIAPQFPY